MPIQLRRQLRHKYKSTKYTESKSEQQVFKIAQHTVMLMLKKWKVKKKQQITETLSTQIHSYAKRLKILFMVNSFLLFSVFTLFLVVGSVR